jgi:G3E family GTPase
MIPRLLRHLVASVADEVVQPANGCICCTINGDLLDAAERVLAIQHAVDRIFVETTGLADPLPAGLTFLQTDLCKRTALKAVVTAVGCANFASICSRPTRRWRRSCMPT